VELLNMTVQVQRMNGPAYRGRESEQNDWL
jgi:hypothetical protein